MRARKRFGQHFLEPAWVEKVLAAVAPQPGDAFVEIGPGRGAMTLPLARRVSRIVAVEIDRELAAGEFPPNVTVVEGDILDIDLIPLVGGVGPPVRVIGNLPYNIASPILFRLLTVADDGKRFSDATLMLQREVADRVVALPGSGDYGPLAVQVSLACDARTCLTLPPGAFRPAPKVTSSVVALRFRPPVEDVGDRRLFEMLVRGVFLHRRKTVANALKWVDLVAGRSIPALLEQTGIDGARRPEELSLADFARLSRAVL